MDKKYIIVGGVAGGISAALRLRRLDEKAKVTILEKGQTVAFANCGVPYYIGGTVKNSSELIRYTPGNFKKKFNIDVKVNTEVTGINRRDKKVEIKNLATGKKYIQKYDKLVLASCAIQLRPQINGIESEKVFTVRSIADSIAITEYINSNNVRRVVIISGGYIGLQLAENIVKRGLNTFIVEPSDHVLTVFDYDMSQFVANELVKNGVLLITEASVTSIKEAEEGLNVELSNGQTLNIDMVIVGTGVVPEVDLAKKAELGIGITGGILVDEHQQTTDKDIYATGDAVEVECHAGGKEIIPNISSADKQGRIAADNICGIVSRNRKSLSVTILKLFDSVFACAGLTEKQLNARKDKFEKIYTRSYSHEQYYPDSSILTIKLMFEKKTGKILGVQIAGQNGVDKRIDVFATAMRAGLTAEKLGELELAYAPPFGVARDPVNSAGTVVSDIMNGLTDIVHWHDIDRNRSKFLLDVRSNSEYESGTIEGAINIPIIELRSRYTELPKKKGIIVFCSNGQDAYTAERMLKQRGFSVKNLSGGYSLYEMFSRNKMVK